ncbi:hypothetical protein AMQ84_28710 [Paenibacillus riograndensis]|uniref:Uncharacterized protein n=1 Tax=Paenibacillus riograndensis TaxID=483937 RepID=A0A132TIZ1_9BACL|nr:hypothetical protein [Paenibacillus riograndensis]KWX71006.1 hypothetical protein AMQ84_28710 [Paenibacillus riograndensis]
MEPEAFRNQIREEAQRILNATDITLSVAFFIIEYVNIKEINNKEYVLQRLWDTAKPIIRKEDIR